jgi:nucleoside phosphorylase
MQMEARIPPRPQSRRQFEVAIICALPIESDAVQGLFDRFWDEDGDPYGKAPGDQNSYTTGVIGNHNVVLAYMPGMGKGYAASVAASFRSSFGGIRLALVVGVCGGIPKPNNCDLFLGDIVISDEVVVYDFGRRLPDKFIRRDTTGSGIPNQEVRTFLAKIKSWIGHPRLRKKTAHHLGLLQQRTNNYQHPGRDQDKLFQPAYHHKHYGSSSCKRCARGGICKKARVATCEELQCDHGHLIIRSPPTRPSQGNHELFEIHFGRIASGDTVMKSGEDRDSIAHQENVIAFEMEGAGVLGNLPCIIVKGVCDYADSHKDKTWQKYAAGSAAACMKALLEQWAVTDYSSSDIIDGLS